LVGQVALITGAARGLGFEIARGLAAAGATVLLNGRSREALERAAEEIVSTGGQALPITFDITDGAAVTGAISDAMEAHRRLDILVNNVRARDRRAVFEFSLDDLGRLM
jgi:gluconate 5-dehydrogenase